MGEEIRNRACVLGIGNVLLMDEGVGLAVTEALRRDGRLPAGVDVIDCATMGLALLGDLRGRDCVVVVDAVDGTGLPPGTVVRFSPDDIARSGRPVSAHDTTFADVIDAARLIGCEPRCFCVGVQVRDMSPADFEMGLSPEVESSVPAAVDAVLAALREMGIG